MNFFEHLELCLQGHYLFFAFGELDFQLLFGFGFIRDCQSFAQFHQKIVLYRLRNAPEYGKLKRRLLKILGKRSGQYLQIIGYIFLLDLPLLQVPIDKIAQRWRVIVSLLLKFFRIIHFVFLLVLDIVLNYVLQCICFSF